MKHATTFRRLGLSSLALIAIGIASLSYAAPSPDEACHGQHAGKAEHQFPPFLRGITLTAAQEAQIKALDIPDQRPDPSEIKAQQQEMQALISTAQFDNAKAQELINRRSQTINALMLKRLANDQRIFALLNAEQQAQAKENMNRMPPRRGEER